MITLLLLHTHLLLPHEECDSPDQAAHYLKLGPKLGASSLTWHLVGIRVKVPVVQFYTFSRIHGKIIYAFLLLLWLHGPFSLALASVFMLLER
jgi:hypothetical protein